MRLDVIKQVVTCKITMYITMYITRRCTIYVSDILNKLDTGKDNYFLVFFSSFNQLCILVKYSSLDMSYFDIKGSLENKD